MAYSCDVCKKNSLKGRKITVAWGVKYKTIRHRKPNIRKTTLLVNNKKEQHHVCASCLKSIKAGKIKGYKYPNYLEKTVKTKETAE